jgi:transposase-like protein
MRNNFNNSSYSDQFKKNAVKQLLATGSKGLTATASKMGIPTSTLATWKSKYAINIDMNNSKNKTIREWTPEEKLEAIIKTSSMTEAEQGEYIRSNGLHSTDLDTFKMDALAGFKSTGRPKLDPEINVLRKEKKKLEKDIQRKDKALAEYSARVILLKKSHEIWGDPEEDE